MKSPAVTQSDAADIPPENPVVQQVARHIEELLQSQLPDGMTYHNIDHTSDVVEAAQRIGRHSGLSSEEMEILCIAAWMHDVGYTRTYQGHEEESARMAAEFLRGIGYPEEKIRRVSDAIMATRMPQSPRTLVEDALCDADLIHLAHKDFLEKGRLLRLEWEHVRGVTYSEVEWLRFNLDFIQGHSYNTTYVRNKFDEQRLKNIKRLRRKIRKLLEEDPTAPHAQTPMVTASENGAVHTRDTEVTKERKKEKKEKKPERGIETMFRITSRNHIDLSSIADHKANIMITTNALVISLVVSLLGRALDNHPYLLIPTLMMLGVCVTAIVFATLSTRPSITSGIFTSEDIRQRKANLLFFGNFYNMSLEDYESGIRAMMNDPEYLYGSMIKDIYFLGKVLGRKYRYLRICYSIFMYGLVVSVIAFGVAFIVGS